ncbi:MAG: hypothetical protein ACTFAK_14810 [Candidatus Electronema sp. VV]
MIIEDKPVYSVGDIIGYNVYVSNQGKDAAPNVTIDLTFAAGVDVKAANCAGAHDSSCENLTVGKPYFKI